MNPHLQHLNEKIDKCVADLERYKDEGEAIRSLVIERLHMEARRKRELEEYLDRVSGNSVYMGNVSVDSGCIMITDPCYVAHPKEYDSEGRRYVRHPEKSWGSEEDYETATDAAIMFAREAREGQAQFHVKGAATAVGISIGDWNWPVYANYNDDGELVSIELRVREEEK